MITCSMDYNEADWYHAFHQLPFYRKGLVKRAMEKVKEVRPDISVYHAQITQVKRGVILLTVFTEKGNIEVEIIK